MKKITILISILLISFPVLAYAHGNPTRNTVMVSKSNELVFLVKGAIPIAKRSTPQLEAVSGPSAGTSIGPDIDTSRGGTGTGPSPEFGAEHPN